MVLVGFVHSRSEVGKDGAVELVWGIGIDMKIVDFRLQRCRSSSRGEIIGSEFMKSLYGRDCLSLSKMTHADSLPHLSAKAQPLASTILKSAAKTLLVTRIAFGESILPERLVANVYRFFPNTSNIEQVELNEEDISGSEKGVVQSFIVLRSIGADQRRLGSLVYLLKGGSEYWWAFDDGGNAKEGLSIGMDKIPEDALLAEIRERLDEANVIL